MPTQKVIQAEVMVNPIDRTAATPSIAFGGSQEPNQNSGTGFHGTYGNVNVDVNAVTVATFTSAGMSVAGAISSSSPLSPISLTTAQRNALTPVAGMIIFNSTDSVHQGYNGTTWMDFYTNA